MQKLKIAIVVGAFPTVSETFIVNQINTLIEAGHSVQIFAYNKGNLKNFHSSVIKHNLLGNVTYFKKKSGSRSKDFIFLLKWTIDNIFRISWRNYLFALNPFKIRKQFLSLDMFYKAQWFLIAKRFDIVHAHFGPNAERIAFLKSMGFLRKARLVSTFHGFDLILNNEENYNDKYKFLLQESSAFTVNSKYLEDILLSLSTDSTNVHIVPVGLDTSFFKKSNPKKINSSFSLLFCGRLIELKGPLIAVEILKELIDRGHNTATLTIIGDGNLKVDILAKIQSVHLGNEIKLTGALSQDAIKEKMEHVDVFLMPGIHDPLTGRAEAQGLVLQEAQAMELPVVISDVGGMKYGMIPNETGFVVKENDIKGFADAIESLIVNKKLRESMGKRGREYVMANFDNKVLCKKLLAIYQDVLIR